MEGGWGALSPCCGFRVGAKIGFGTCSSSRIGDGANDRLDIDFVSGFAGLSVAVGRLRRFEKLTGDWLFEKVNSLGIVSPNLEGDMPTRDEEDDAGTASEGV